MPVRHAHSIGRPLLRSHDKEAGNSADAAGPLQQAQLRCQRVALIDSKCLLDENLDWRLRRDLPGHETESVPLIGWAGIQNDVDSRYTNRSPASLAGLTV